MPAKKISINVARVVETHQPHESHQSSKPFQVFYKIGIRYICRLLLQLLFSLGLPPWSLCSPFGCAALCCRIKTIDE